MTDWKSPKVEKPPQARKILWFNKGELFVTHRFGDKYLCITPVGAKILEEPMLWALAPMPDPYDGFMLFRIDDNKEMLTLDEVEEKFPEDYKQLVDMIENHRIEE